MPTERSHIQGPFEGLRLTVTLNRSFFAFNSIPCGTSFVFFEVGLSVSVNGRPFETMDKTLGEVPVMLRSKACNLRSLTARQLMTKNEEPVEHGGYFVVNGSDKVSALFLCIQSLVS